MRLAYIILFVFISTFSFAQNRLKAIVKDNQSGEPLSGAAAVVKGGTLGATTNAEGVLEIQNIPNGSQVIEVSFVGYESETLELTFPLTASDPIVVELGSGHEELEEIVISSTRSSLTDRVTLFRTLKTFEEHKIIHSIDDGSGSAKYAICNDTCECDYPQDVHVHFYCKICNETQCLPKVIVPSVNLPSGYSAEEANVVVKAFVTSAPRNNAIYLHC